MRYRVTQYDSRGGYVHSKAYRWRWVAMIAAWALAANGPGGASYFTEVEEER